jgi:hypothetical protein
MIPEAPFLFSIAGLSASLAGLAGLVAALRRGTELRAIDAFRLREIVEFAFANVLFCVAVVPLAQTLPGGTADVVRVAAGLSILYGVSSTVVLGLRNRRARIGWTVGWTAAAAGLLIASVLTALAAIATGSIATYEGLLVLMLARPMLAFLLVLASFESPASVDTLRPEVGIGGTDTHAGKY